MAISIYKYWFIVIGILILFSLAFGKGIDEINVYGVIMYLMGTFSLCPLMLKKDTSAPFGAGRLKVDENSFARFVFFILYGILTFIGLLGAINFDST